jgi:RNA polymerase-binding protein DksA
MEGEALKKSRLDASGDLSSMPIHMADIGSDIYEQEFALGLMDSERKLIREIDDALQRIEQHTYGICEGTGKPISKARLEAQPWARYCIEYARLLEKGLVAKSEKPTLEFQDYQDEREPEDEGESESGPED